MGIKFEKMHGLGNDFVIIDERKSPMQILAHDQREELVQHIANRKTGVGCDQLIVMRPSSRADVYMQIYNADGSEVAACGNATRCVGWLLMREKRSEHVFIETEAGFLAAQLAGKERIAVNLGLPGLGWEDIPLARQEDTLHLSLKKDNFRDPVGVSMGNPHMVFFVEDVGKVPLRAVGSELEHDPLYPERANVNFVQVDSKSHLTLRTWERGAGETLACGTGACATMVAARRRGLVESEVTVLMPGGELTIRWDGSEGDPEHDVWMTGPIAHAFSGELDDKFWV